MASGDVIGRSWLQRDDASGEGPVKARPSHTGPPPRPHDWAMRDLPSGIVTVLCTDIEGSTRLLHEHGEGYVHLLTEHRRELRAIFTRRDGVEVDTQGDAFFVAFARAEDAVAAAEEIQGIDGPVR